MNLSPRLLYLKNSLVLLEDLELVVPDEDGAPVRPVVVRQVDARRIRLGHKPEPNVCVFNFFLFVFYLENL